MQVILKMKKSTSSYLLKQRSQKCVNYKIKPKNRLFRLSQIDRVVLKRGLCHPESFNAKQAFPAEDFCTNLLIARATHTNLHIGATPEV